MSKNNKLSLATKLKEHYSANKLEYTKFGYYCLGVAAMTVTYTLLEKYAVKQRELKWDAVHSDQVELFGEEVITLRDRDGNFFYSTPIPTEN